MLRRQLKLDGRKVYIHSCDTQTHRSVDIRTAAYLSVYFTAGYQLDPNTVSTPQDSLNF